MADEYAVRSKQSGSVYRALMQSVSAIAAYKECPMLITGIGEEVWPLALVPLSRK